MSSEKSHYNNWIWFIGFAFVAVLAVYAFRSLIYTPNITKVTISITVPPDSIAASATSKQAVQTLDSLSNVITKQEKELHHYYDLFIKARQDDADMMKILSILGALIIAFGTFFGIRNLKDFKDNIAEDAKQSASDTAKRITENITKSTLRSTVSAEIRRSLDNNYFYLDMKSRIQDEIVSTFLPGLQEDVEKLKREMASLGKDGEDEDEDSQQAEATGTNPEEPISPIPDVPEDN